MYCKTNNLNMFVSSCATNQVWISCIDMKKSCTFAVAVLEAGATLSIDPKFT